MALRQQVWIDKSVQGVLVGRVVLYWLCGVLYVGVGSACFQYYQNPDSSLLDHMTVLFHQIWPWLPTAILVLPLAIYDVVRLSNMFVGPIYRLRKHFSLLHSDMNSTPLNFREDDYWLDLPNMVNEMQAEILTLRHAVSELNAKTVQDAQSLADLRSGAANGELEPNQSDFDIVVPILPSHDEECPAPTPTLV
jgi:hypothetical protein